MARFTDRSIKALALPAGKKDMLVFDDECRGLGVRVTAKGTKAFIVQWTDRATKKRIREPLGAWGSITLEQARSAVRARLGDVARGIDPVAQRQARKAAAEAEKAEASLTVEKLIQQWSDIHLSARRESYRGEAVRALRLGFADYLRRPAARLSRNDVITVLDRITSDGRQGSARMLMAYGRACFAWAEKRGRIPSSPFHRLPMAIPAAERERVLDRQECREIWDAAGKLGYPFGPYYRLAMLTLQRRDEVAGMRWSEISADGATWTIPTARMKNNRPHDVHLSKAAREVLDTIPRQLDADGKPIDFVFTTTGRSAIVGFSRSKTSLDAAVAKARAAAGAENAKPIADWRTHDFRRTGVTRLAEMGFDSIVVDKLLSHKPSKLRGVASIYQRHSFLDERRKALDAWAAEVTSEPPAGNVVQLRA